MRPFRYLRDPLFLVSCAAYAINRWLIKAHLHSDFLHSHFNDLLLIPCALPPILWLHRQFGLRSHDQAPTVLEIASHLGFWSAWFEWLGPKFVSHATADPLDVLAYLAGALLAGVWWHRERWLVTLSRS